MGVELLARQIPSAFGAPFRGSIANESVTKNLLEVTPMTPLIHRSFAQL
jgi:hypothetical protein